MARVWKIGVGAIALTIGLGALSYFLTRSPEHYFVSNPGYEETGQQQEAVMFFLKQKAYTAPSITTRHYSKPRNCIVDEEVPESLEAVADSLRPDALAEAIYPSIASRHVFLTCLLCFGIETLAHGFESSICSLLFLLLFF